MDVAVSKFADKVGRGSVVYAVNDVYYIDENETAKRRQCVIQLQRKLLNKKKKEGK